MTRSSPSAAPENARHAASAYQTVPRLSAVLVRPSFPGQLWPRQLCGVCRGDNTATTRALTSIGAAIRGAQVGSAPAHPWHARSRLGVRVSNYCERGVFNEGRFRASVHRRPLRWSRGRPPSARRQRSASRHRGARPPHHRHHLSHLLRTRTTCRCHAFRRQPQPLHQHSFRSRSASPRLHKWSRLSL